MQNFDEFMEVVRKIRKSCPWDKVQTDSENLCEELGDVLFQVALHSVIAQEEGLFTIEDVIDGISSKMQFRHPKIFVPEDETMTSLSWDQLKEIEKSRKTKKL